MQDLNNRNCIALHPMARHLLTMGWTTDDEWTTNDPASATNAYSGPHSRPAIKGLQICKDKVTTRPTSRSRKLLRLAEDILRLASRLAAAYGLRLKSADINRLSKVTV